MTRWLRLVIVGSAALAASIGSVGIASAQEGQGAGRIEVTGFPGGGIYFTRGGQGTNEPGFGDYALGGSLTYNINRWWGVEGEVAGSFGIEQRLGFAGRSVGDLTPPDTLAYNGNVVFYPWQNDRSLVPYVTGGVGGLTMFETREVGFNDDKTFFTGNVGGGVKWYRGRWGLRGDYRFFGVGSKDDVSGFFGKADTRYGHRVYGGIILNVSR